MGAGWIAPLAILVLIVAHVVLLGAVTRLHYAVLLAAGAVGIAALKYGWWRLRR